MFELEVAHQRLTSGSLPPEIRERFLEPRSITHIGHVMWEEHCTECAWPQCYHSCDLYNARNDGNCRRTIDGFSPVPDAPVLGGHVVRVRFRRWASLTTRCLLSLRPVRAVEKIERRFNALSRVAAGAPRVGTLIGRPGLPSRVVRRLKAYSVNAPPDDDANEPTSFIMEVFNPTSSAV